MSGKICGIGPNSKPLQPRESARAGLVIALGAIVSVAGVLGALAAAGLPLGPLNALGHLTIAGGGATAGVGGLSAAGGGAWLAIRGAMSKKAKPDERDVTDDADSGTEGISSVDAPVGASPPMSGSRRAAAAAAAEVPDRDGVIDLETLVQFRAAEVQHTSFTQELDQFLAEWALSSVEGLEPLPEVILPPGREGDRNHVRLHGEQFLDLIQRDYTRLVEGVTNPHHVLAIVDCLEDRLATYNGLRQEQGATEALPTPQALHDARATANGSLAELEARVQEFLRDREFSSSEAAPLAIHFREQLPQLTRLIQQWNLMDQELRECMFQLNVDSGYPLIRLDPLLSEGDPARIAQVLTRLASEFPQADAPIWEQYPTIRESLAGFLRAHIAPTSLSHYPTDPADILREALMGAALNRIIERVAPNLIQDLVPESGGRAAGGAGAGRPLGPSQADIEAIIAAQNGD